jgi:uncharacterized damage-inducible protein DinB
MSRAIRIAAAALVCAAVPVMLTAQTAAQNSATRAGMKGTHDVVKAWYLKAVEQVGEELYAFKPTPEVRSMGQLFGHVANANFMICSMASGEKSTAAGDYEKVTSKAAMAKAIADSFAFCDKAWAAVAGEKGTEPVEIFGMKHTRASALAFNTAHDWEHYGNLVTYMRLKGMVPPSSQGGGGN